MTRIAPTGSADVGVCPADFEPQTETPSRVHINGTRIPAGDVDIHIRNEGPVSITRYVEVYFYSPVFGKDWLECFDTAYDEQDGWDTIQIDVKDTETSTYNTEFVGLVSGVGNSGNDMEKEFLVRAQGPGQIVDKIPASINFGTGSEINAGTVLTYIGEELEDHLPINVVTQTDLESFKRPFITWFFDTLTLTGKTFQPNKDTLADVVAWFEDRTNSKVWLQLTEDGLTLVAVRNPERINHTAHYLGGDLGVIDNNALNEIKPINTVVVKGAAKKSLHVTEDFQINAVGDDQYYVAKARHQPLYEKSGNTEYMVEEYVSDAASSDQVKSEARSMLKKRIQEATGGNMLTLLRSPIKPFDTVTAKPTCKESPATNADETT